MALQISVLIPHYNDLINLELCLDALEQQTLPRDEFEIIVADNNSSCGVEAVRAVVDGRGLVVLAIEQGAGPARNVAARHASANAFACIDSDCVPDSDWLEHGLAALGRSEIVGGAVTATARDPFRPTPSESFELVFAFQMQRYVERKGFAGGGNLFVRRNVFETVGGFRSGVVDDEEWGRRAMGLGYRTVYDDRVRVSHPARRNWEELRRKLKRNTLERYLLAREQRFGWLVWIARSWIVLLSPSVHVGKVIVSPRLMNYRARLGAIAILFRSRAYRFIEANRIFLRDIGAKDSTKT